MIQIRFFHFFILVLFSSSLFAQDLDEYSSIFNSFEHTEYDSCINNADTFLKSSLCNLYLRHHYGFSIGGETQWRCLTALGMKGLALLNLNRIDESITTLQLFDSLLIIGFRQDQIQKTLNSNLTKYNLEKELNNNEDYNSNKSTIVLFRGTLGWALIKQGNFKSAQLYCQYAYNSNSKNLAWTLNYAHALFLMGDIKTGRKLYSDALTLIPDSISFRENVVEDFKYFIEKGWKTNLFNEQLSVMKETFYSQNALWNSQRSDEFQVCNTADEITGLSIAISRDNINQIFHYLTKYKYYDYNSAAKDNSEINQFKLRRIKVEHDSILTSTKTVGHRFSTKFVMNKKMKFESEKYDFNEHAFKINFVPIITNLLPNEILLYSDSPLNTDNVRSSISYNITNIPKTLKIKVVSENFAEELSKESTELLAYIEVPDQRELKYITVVEPSSYFSMYLLQNGYMDYEAIPLNKLNQLKKIFMDKYSYYGSPLIKHKKFQLNVDIRMLQLIFPNGQKMNWYPSLD